MFCEVCRLWCTGASIGAAYWPDGTPVSRCHYCVKEDRTPPQEEREAFRKWSASPLCNGRDSSFENFILGLGRKPSGWRALITYADKLDMWVRELFEMLAELVPIPTEGDRIGNYLKWIDNAVELGLLKPEEKSRLSSWVGPHM